MQKPEMIRLVWAMHRHLLSSIHGVTSFRKYCDFDCAHQCPRKQHSMMHLFHRIDYIHLLLLKLISPCLQWISIYSVKVFIRILNEFPIGFYQSMMHEFPVFRHCTLSHVPTYQNLVFDRNVQHNTPNFARMLLHPKMRDWIIKIIFRKSSIQFNRLLECKWFASLR